MIGLKINQAKSMFFDRPKVMSAVDRATCRVLRRFGAFVMTTAKQSIKRPGKSAKTKTSQPGQPPRNQMGFLKNFILFDYDRDRNSVVIGPAKLDKKTDAPHILEYGGDTTLELGRNRRKERVHIAARPYMGPAYKKEIEKLDPLWRDSIR